MSESLFLLAVAPGLALMVYFYLSDRYEREPPGFILRVMLAGALVVGPAIGLEALACRLLGLDLPPPEMTGLQRATWSFLIAGGVEESLKLAVVLAVVFRDPEFDEPYDGIVYCVASALGFATLENLKMVALYGEGPGWARAFLTVPAHALFGVAMGYFVGPARFARRTLPLLAAGLGAAVALHGAYDWLLMAPDPRAPLLLLPLTACAWLAALAALRQRLWESPFRPRGADEPDPGSGA